MLRPAAAWGVVLSLASVPVSAAEPRDALARARQFYNQGQFAEAIAAADEARRIPDRADRADLVAARAYLEHFRANAGPDDLGSARDRLRRIDPSRFTPGERVEFVVGLGETLFFEEASGASAVLFESVLSGQSAMTPAARERVLDWWATALDRDARPRPDIDRQSIYQRIRERAAGELAVNPGNGAAAYWVSAAARGQGDLQAAWDAARAGWVRSSLTPDRGMALRADLDWLVLRAIVPERARMTAQPPDVLAAEWERFKEAWRQ